MKGLIRLISKLWLIGLPFVFLWGVYYVFFDEVTKEVAIFLTIYFIIGGFLFGERAPCSKDYITDPRYFYLPDNIYYSDFSDDKV